MTNVVPAEASPATRRLTKRDPLLRLAREVLAGQLAVLRQVPATASAELDPETIHELRVAIRRSRVALRLFENLLPAESGHLRPGLRSIGRALGQVRDLDVYRAGLDAAAESLPIGAAALETRLEAQCAEARRHLAAELAAPRYTALLLELEGLVQREPTPGALRRWHSLTIVSAARSDLHRARKRVLALGRKIDAESTPQALHRLRIRAKRLRYEGEFYAPYLAAADKLAREAERLQDALGEYRDACQAIDRLHDDRVALAGDPDCVAAIDALVEAQQVRTATARDAFPAAWQRFVRQSGKRKLGTRNH